MASATSRNTNPIPGCRERDIEGVAVPESVTETSLAY